MKVFKTKLLWLTFVSTLLLIIPACTDDCKEVACQNGGACTEGVCECLNGFTGTKCENEDKCITKKVSCLNGGACVDGTCKCPDDFTGPDCATKVVEPCDEVNCQNGGTCLNGSCDCLDGFSGDRCQNEDLCITLGIVCQNGGNCINGECNCPDDFTGPSCETKIVNPCDNVNCQNGGTCTNGACNCPNGYSGAMCEKEDKCITQNPNCLNGGVCIDGKCDCPSGYSGTRCQNFDPCVGVICRNGGRCVNGACDCPLGYTGPDCGTKRTPKAMIIKQIGFKKYPLVSGSGGGWDGDNGPEVYFTIDKGTSSNRKSYATNYLNNNELPSGGKEVILNVISRERIDLVNSDWDIGMYDYDSDGKHDFMCGIYFKPINNTFQEKIRLYNSSSGCEFFLYVEWEF